MNGAGAARPLRLGLVACLVGVTFAIVVGGLGVVVQSTQVAVLLPFVAAAVSVTGLSIALPRIDRLVRHITQKPSTTPDFSLTRVAAGIEAGSVEQALLRGTQLNAELQKRVRRADELAAELQASRQRLTRARDVERHRLIAELTHVTTDRLVALRAELINAQRPPSGDTAWPEHAQRAIARARTGLDELLDRFRVIARGVYPTVLRNQGPYGALDELATDLVRPVCLSGNLSRRLAWEVESGIYYLAASAMQQLAGRPAGQPLKVHLEHGEGRLAVRIDDPTPAAAAGDVLAALTVDVDRLAALGGAVEIGEDGAGSIALRAWLPDQLEPSVDELAQRRPGPFHDQGLP
ncbi:MAG: hypothetical protein ACRDRO_13050 [Pseudonocardiaceae bacterium]